LLEIWQDRERVCMLPTAKNDALDLLRFGQGGFVANALPYCIDRRSTDYGRICLSIVPVNANNSNATACPPGYTQSMTHTKYSRL